MRPTGHIRARSPGAFEIRYSLGTDPATGQRRIATMTVRGTRKEAEKELRRLLRSLDTVRHEVALRSYERYAVIVQPTPDSRTR